MVVLATKLYVAGDARERALDGLEALVTNAVEDLDVEFELGVRHDDFPSVTLSGEDATAARNVLEAEWGAITPTFEAGETYVGTLESWSPEGWTLDAGEEIQVPTEALALGPGDATQLRDRFGLVQHQRFEFEYGDPPRLTDDQVDRLFDWQRGTGRVNVNSATRGEVRATVNRAGHAEDIVTVERLGLLEQSIVCKPGTDPPGLLAAIGEYLPAEIRCVVP